MRRRLLLGLVPLLPLPLLFVGCGEPGVSLGLGMISPQGLLDQATGVTLYVFPASMATCDGATGHASQIPSSAQSFPLGTKGCPGGDEYCATVQLTEDDSDQMFAVEATAGSTTIAEGCVTKVIDQDPLSVDIQIHRYTPATCCNDGVLEPGEQCDPGVPAKGAGKCGGIPADAVCNGDCTAKEILLSIDDKVAPGLKNGPAGTKTGLAMAFGPGGVSSPIMLRAVYTSTDSQAVGTSDVHESFLGQDLYPISDPYPLSLQLELPLLCSNVAAGGGTPRQQETPAIAAVSDATVAVVYASDQAIGGSDFDVLLTPQTADGCFDDIPCMSNGDCQTSCGNGGTCAPAITLNTIPGGSTDPHVAAAGISGTALVTWTRVQGVVGRIWREDGSLAPKSAELSIGPQGSSARVTGNANGFVVVYHGPGTDDPDGVYMTTVTPTGTVGTPVLVNEMKGGTQDQPDVAMLADGAWVVVFRSGGDIYFQRYTAAGVQRQRRPGRAAQHDPRWRRGQSSPAVAGNSGFFTAAWETTNTEGPNIAARFIGEQSGFGYNTVTWQNDQFTATGLKQPGERHLPAVAMSTFVAIGWQDVSAAHPGIYVAPGFPALHGVRAPPPPPPSQILRPFPELTDAHIHPPHPSLPLSVSSLLLCDSSQYLLPTL